MKTSRCIEIMALDGVTPTRVFLENRGGRFFGKLRAKDRATFWTIAEAENLAVRDADGKLAPNKGVSIVEIGAMVITPAVLDPTTLEVTTPAVMDDRHHVDLLVGPPRSDVVDEVTGRTKLDLLALAWTLAGTDDTNKNAAEEAKVLRDIGLIDLDTISSQSHTF